MLFCGFQYNFIAFCSKDDVITILPSFSDKLTHFVDNNVILLAVVGTGVVVSFIYYKFFYKSADPTPIDTAPSSPKAPDTPLGSTNSSISSDTAFSAVEPVPLSIFPTDVPEVPLLSTFMPAVPMGPRLDLADLNSPVSDDGEFFDALSTHSVVDNGLNLSSLVIDLPVSPKSVVVSIEVLPSSSPNPIAVSISVPESSGIALPPSSNSSAGSPVFYDAVSVHPAPVVNSPVSEGEEFFDAVSRHAPELIDDNEDSGD